MMDDKDTLLDEHKDNVRRNRMGRSTVWKWSTLVLLVLLVIAVYANGFPGFGSPDGDAAAEKAVAFINENLLAGFATATLVSVTEENDLYKLELDLTTASGLTQNASLYLTKDGELLFPSAIDLSAYEQAAPEENETQVDTEIVAAEDPILGNPDAKLSIVEYSDFECPFCGKAYWTVKLILDEYPDDVNLVYMNWPLPPGTHPFAQKAAEAAECANVQGKFAEYHDMLFENQDALAVEDLKQYAADIELDTDAFNSCLDSGAMADEVLADKEEGTNLGVTGTPTFFIGEQKVEGNQKFEDFKVIIDEELAKLAMPSEEASNETVSEEVPMNETEEPAMPANESEEPANETAVNSTA